MKKKFLIFLLLIFLLNISKINAFLLEETKKYVEIHCLFGLPEQENKDFYIFRKQYIVNYNYNLNITNFVLYSLRKEDYGNVKRYSGTYLYDTLISKLKLQKITHSSYTNSGYDRGHLVRSEERTNSIENNKSTFLMTNIVPQTPDVNSGVWFRLEQYCEELVKYNKELYIISGTIFKKQKTYYNNLIIPDTLFKIIIINNNRSTKRIFLKNLNVIAVKIPNKKGLRKANWEDYICTIKDIENSVGYNFNATLSKTFQDKLEKIKKS